MFYILGILNTVFNDWNQNYLQNTKLFVLTDSISHYPLYKYVFRREWLVFYIICAPSVTMYIFLQLFIKL